MEQDLPLEKRHYLGHVRGELGFNKLEAKQLLNKLQRIDGDFKSITADTYDEWEVETVLRETRYDLEIYFVDLLNYSYKHYFPAPAYEALGYFDAEDELVDFKRELKCAIERVATNYNQQVWSLEESERNPVRFFYKYCQIQFEADNNRLNLHYIRD